MMPSKQPSLLPEIGPDGLAREPPIIAYTEKIIAEEQLQLKKYIEENYSKIRDVERELSELNLEIKRTSGPKKAALEHMRKKIEMSTEKIRLAKLKEEQARKAWEEASKAVKDEEDIKQRLCEDLNCLVQESSSNQFSRLEELKRRLEAMNPSRASTSVLQDLKPAQINAVLEASSLPRTIEQPDGGVDSRPESGSTGNGAIMNGHDQPRSIEVEGRGRKKSAFHGRGKGLGAVPKGRGSAAPGWTGAGFDVDGKS